MPHWDECNSRGPIILALESKGKFTLRKWDKKELYDSRFKSWTISGRFVCSSAPQLPLNAFLNPFSKTRSLKYSK